MMLILAGICEVAQARPAGIDRPLIAAHRGASESAAENTIPAFLEAIRHGSDAVEADVRMTVDGVPVILHDARLNRTTNGRGAVGSTTGIALSKLETAYGEPVPTLAGLLDALGPTNARIVLDLKAEDEALVTAVVQLLRSSAMEERTFLGVRSVEMLRRAAAVDGGARVIAFPDKVEMVDAYLEAGARAVRLWPRWLAAQPDLGERLRKAGIGIWLTTGRRAPASVAEYLSLVDGVITDRPGLFARFVARMESRHIAGSL